MANETADSKNDVSTTPKLNNLPNEDREDDLDDWETNAKLNQLNLNEENGDDVELDNEEPNEPDVKPKAQKSNNAELPELDKPRKDHYNIVFIGHVDAGKSTIGGQLLYLTGQVDKRTLEKYEREAKDKNRESWYLSWALDTNQEERDKGKTVEVGRGFFETENKCWTLLDAPGIILFS